MKHLIFSILENGSKCEEVLSSLSKAGYNGTVIASTSLKHSLANEGEVPMFFNLALIESNKFENNTTLYIVAEEKEVNDVKEIRKKHTNNFKDCKGGMFVVPLESFEGSF